VILDDLFHRAAEERPDDLALIDPSDRADFTDGAPRRLSWGEADRVISAIANLLQSFGLPAGSVVAFQLPNIVEGVLVLLGVLRAGLIAAPLPLLWRKAEGSAALARVGARVLISCRRVGDADHAELCMHLAAETFAIRFVCAFGRGLPDGIIPLDDVFDDALPARPPVLEAGDDPAERIAIITFDATADGVIPIARTHAELIAGGEAIVRESGLKPGARLLAALMTSSFGGLASTVIPWVLCRGELALHKPFNSAVLRTEPCDVAVVPGALVARFVEAGIPGSPNELKTILAVWRAPERLAAAPPINDGHASIVDVSVFGEIGLLAFQRTSAGTPARLDARAPTLELARTPGGTLAMRGAMVPRHLFLPIADGTAQLKMSDDGFVDTGYPCRIDRETRALILDGPPAGLVAVGGYRFGMRELQDVVKGLDPDGSVAALPDAFAGHRLAGVGSDREAIREQLTDSGANPLVTDAFRDKRPGRASAA